MHPTPETPTLADAPDSLLDGGHLWALEWLDGRPMRASLTDAGYLVFGDAEREYDFADLPLEYRAGARHLRESLDRAALDAAVETVADVTFVGVATCLQSIEYDWSRTPPFVGYDVWTGSRYAPPDAAAEIIDRLGLDPAPAIAKELPARDFDPEQFASADSAYRDGPVAGVLVRNKTGDRARLEVSTDGATDAADAISAVTPANLVSEFVTAERVAAVAAPLGENPDADAVARRLLSALYRERCAVIRQSRSDLDEQAIRATMYEQVTRTLAE